MIRFDASIVCFFVLSILVEEIVQYCLLWQWQFLRFIVVVSSIVCFHHVAASGELIVVTTVCSCSHKIHH